LKNNTTEDIAATLAGALLTSKDDVESIFRMIPAITGHHARTSELRALLDKIIKGHFGDHPSEILDTYPLDGMVWPHSSLGNLSSYSFFSFDELMLYSFYWINKGKYKTVFDLGANIGIDSIILGRFGFDVHAFEPDPQLFETLSNNVSLNNCPNVHLHKKAVSNETGIAEFIRVEGNTTASHIAGVRDYYGDAEHLTIETVAFQEIGIWPDLMKINIEGHENSMIGGIDIKKWKNMDAFIEIHNVENGEGIYNYFAGSGINIFAQNLGWERVGKLAEMPMNNKEGYVFVSAKSEMPWA